MTSLLSSDALYEEKYKKSGEIGRGKFGVVFQVTDREDGQRYAAKHISARRRDQKKVAVEEIKLLQSLNHEHIMKLIGAFESAKEVILVMKYLDGGELFERVIAEDFILTESDCRIFMRQITLGVEYLHDNHVVHLDMKPENVVCVERNGNNIKIVDFGLAKVIRPGEEYRTMCGTVEFVAPEVVAYDKVSSSTDMWSLGVICYILLSGLSPFAGDTDLETYGNISRVKYDFDEEEFDIISADALDFISQLLQKQPENRSSAKQCLSHPWLQLETERKSSQWKKLNCSSRMIISKKNLKRFLAKRRWKRSVQAIIAMRRLSLRTPSPEMIEGDIV